MSTVLVILVFLPAASAFLVALLGNRRAEPVRWLSLLATSATLVLFLLVLTALPPRTAAGPGPIVPQMVTRHAWVVFDPAAGGGGGIEFYLGIDGISVWLVGLTALLMVAAVLVSWESITDRVAEYHALLLMLETGMIGVFCAFDLVLFYVFFEFTLIPLFFLIGIWGGPQKRYAARKFFIYTLAGSVLGLVGLVGLVLSLQGQSPGQGLSFAIPDLARAVAEGRGLPFETQWWIFLALFAGFAIKVPLVPFHTWLPLAHVEAPTAGSVLLAGVLLKLGTYGFLRLCLPFLPQAVLILGVPLISWLAIVGIIYGAMCALAQDDVKKLVAYSSVSHLGFVMLGMFALTAEGIAGSVVQMVNHGLSTGLLFLLVGMFYERYHTRKLSELGGLASRLPLLTVFMVFTCLSSAGLPGLNGFVGEILILMGTFKVHPAYAVLATTGVVLGAWYLLTMLQRAFFGPLREPEGVHGSIRDLKAREIAALVPLATLCLLIGVYPRPMLDRIRPEVRALQRLYASGGNAEAWSTPTAAAPVSED